MIKKVFILITLGLLFTLIYTVKAQVENPNSCVDSDDGINLLEKGITTGWDSYGGDINTLKTYTDTCNGDRILEYHCNYQNDPHNGDGYVSMSNELCENGCEDGACIQDLVEGPDLKITDTEITDIVNNDNLSTNQLVLQLQRQISALEKQVINQEKRFTLLDQKFAEKYAGTMFLDVENHGRLWYVDPASKNRFYFENGVSALSISSKLATGITYEDIQKIPAGVPDKLYNLKDSDGDGLSDRLESALGSDPNKSDTDSDGFSDKQELKNGYNPVVDQKYNYNQNLIDRLEGKMLLQVSGPNSHGEIWYIKDGQRWYGGTEESMYEIMKARSLGATSVDIRKIEVGDVVGME